MAPGERIAMAWVRISSQRSGLVLAIALLVALAGAAGTVHLYGDLRPEMGELLPAGARSARDIATVTRRAGGWAEETVILHGADPGAVQGFAEALAPRFEAIPDLVDAVEWRFEEERRFFRSKRWLFPARADLEELLALIDARIAAGRSGSSAPLGEWVERMRAQAAPLQVYDGFRDGAFLREVDSPEGGRTWALFMRVRFKGDPQNFPRVHALDREVRRVEQETRASLGGLPGVKTVLGGYVANAVFEHEGLIEDLLLASAFVTLAVAAVLALYFRTLKAIPVIVIPIGVGTLVTFGLADLLVGHVNPNTAFLGSIIAGNGVNVTIIVFARYAEERRRGRSADDAITAAIAQTWLGTLTASLAAGVAYASLVSTSFRGFSQFGLIGGLGMGLCWAASYAVLPALVLFWEKRADLIAPDPRPRRPWVMDPLARAIERAPRAVLAAAAVLGVVSAVFAVRFARDPLEWDFSRLRDVRAAKGGQDVPWERAIFGAIQDPSIALADSESEARAMAAAFVERSRQPESRIGSVVSVATFVPEEQAAKIAVLAKIRERIPALLAVLPSAEMAALQGNIPPATITPFGASDLPPMVRRRLSERDGRIGTPVLVSPVATMDVWDGRQAQAWARELRSVPLPRADIPIASSLLLFSDVVDAIRSDGPKAMTLSAIGVLVFVIGTFVLGTRSARGLADGMRVLAVLGAGLLLFAGLAGALKLKINMLSFIALPITLGIGADYAANMVQRQRSSGLSPGDALRTTGGAVALCSLTTVLGYTSLLIAHNNALRSFGMLADLGEVSCLLAALVLLPAAGLALRRERPAS